MKRISVEELCAGRITAHESPIGRSIGNISRKMILRCFGSFHHRFTLNVVGSKCTFDRFIFNLESWSATNITVATFNISDGWNFIGPIGSVRQASSPSCPIKYAAIVNPIATT
jgi:hypothetical protein